MANEIPDSRRGSRLLCSSLIEVAPVHACSRAGVAVGVVEDISERGACVSLDRALAPGAQVVLRTGELEVPCAVKHCFPDESGSHHTGLEFAPGYRWTAGESWPEHRVRP